MKQQVYYIIGPDEKKFNDQEFKEIYKKNDLELVVYGDGEEQVNISKLKFKAHSRVVIDAHGSRSGGKHEIALYSPFFESGSDYTAYNFQSLGNATNNKPLNVEFFSCYGGYAKYDLHHLPPHSTLMTFIDDKYTLYKKYGHDLIKKSAEFSPDNPFFRFASYIMTSSENNVFGINTNKGPRRIEFYSIKNLDNFSEQNIKKWQKEKIQEFSRFLSLNKNDIAEFHHQAIEDFQLMVNNKVELERFVNNYDINQYKMMLFNNLINQDNLNAIKILIEDNNISDLNELIHSNHMYTIGLAEDNNNIEIIEFLIKHYIDVNSFVYSRFLDIALSIAVKNNNLEAAQFFLAEGADVNHNEKFKVTPLNIAVYMGNIEVAKLLLEKGADPSLGPSNKEAIDLALNGFKNGKYEDPTAMQEMIKLILSSGMCSEKTILRNIENNEVAKYLADPVEYILANNISTFHKLKALRNLLKTTVNEEILNNCNKIIAKLIADDGINILIDAATNGDLKTVKYFIDNGFDVNTSEPKEKDSILHLAILSNNKDLVSFLLENGANPQALSIDNFSILHYAAQARNIKIMKLILSKGVDVNSISRSGDTPLTAAIKGINILRNIKLLIQHGADVNHITNDGESPLSLAISEGQIFETKMILATGAVKEEILRNNEVANNSEVRSYKADPFAYVFDNNIALQDKAKAVINLFQNNQNIEINKDNMKIFEKLIENRDFSKYVTMHSEIVQQFIEKGMKIDLADQDGKTLLHYAVENRNYELTDYLLDKGFGVNAKCKADSNVGSWKASPVDFAAYNNDSKMLQLLLEKGASISWETIFNSWGKWTILLSTGACTKEVLLSDFALMQNQEIKEYVDNPLAYVIAHNKNPKDQINAINNLIKNELDNAIKANYHAKLNELIKPKSINREYSKFNLKQVSAYKPGLYLNNQLASNLTINQQSLPGVAKQGNNSSYNILNYESSAEQIIRNLSTGLTMLAIAMNAFGIKVKLPVYKSSVDIDVTNPGLSYDRRFHYISEKAIENVPQEWKKITKEVIEIAKTADVAEWSQDQWQKFIKDSKNFKLFVEIAAKEAKEREKHSRPLTQKDLVEHPSTTLSHQHKQKNGRKY